VVDSDVAFTQGLGTFIMFDVRWQRCTEHDKYGVPEGSVMVFLENNMSARQTHRQAQCSVRPLSCSWVANHLLPLSFPVVV
jgi:hypothetical protein